MAGRILGRTSWSANPKQGDAARSLESLALSWACELSHGRRRRIEAMLRISVMDAFIADSVACSFSFRGTLLRKPSVDLTRLPLCRRFGTAVTARLNPRKKSMTGVHARDCFVDGLCVMAVGQSFGYISHPVSIFLNLPSSAASHDSVASCLITRLLCAATTEPVMPRSNVSSSVPYTFI